MATASVIPAAKAALETLFEAESELAGVLIARGAADSNRQADEIVLGTAKFEHTFAGLGRPAALNEEFEISLGISAFVEGATDYALPEARLWTLVSIVEDVIRFNHKAGGAHFQRVSRGEQTYFTGDKGKGAECVLTVTGKSSIRD